MCKKSGQSLIESCVVIFLISLIFVGLLQFSLLNAAQETAQHAASRGARARTVGFNKFMVMKSIRVGAIPNSGKLLNPVPDQSNDQLLLNIINNASNEWAIWEAVMDQGQPRSYQVQLEKLHIPQYMASENNARGNALLNYENWETIRIDDATTPYLVDIVVEQDYEMKIPLHRAIYEADELTIQGSSQLENHFSLYLVDNYW